jgi:hypothetical protein
VLGGEDILEGWAWSVPIAIASIAAMHIDFNRPNPACAEVCEDAIPIGENDRRGEKTAKRRMIASYTYLAPM